MMQKERLETKVRELFEANKKSYGSRRLSDALKTADINAERYNVRRLMARLELKTRYPKRYKVTTDNDHNEAISPN